MTPNLATTATSTSNILPLRPRAEELPRALGARAIPPGLPETGLRYLIQAACALLAALALLPVVLLVAIAVKLTSPGPLFYAGIRVGKNQRLYTMYKFRTLRIGSEKKIGGRLLSAQDDFYTPIGRFLKKSKLDEVPQLWNVLRGEMNFVGPRPLRPIFLERYLDEIPAYADRFRVAPGMTGLAQVRGGYFTSPRNKLRYDQLYIHHRTLPLDAALVTLTALKVLNRWLTLGAFLLVLLLFVSFLPQANLENLYIERLGVRVNPLHGLIAFGALWMVLRRAPSDRLQIYRTPLNLPIAVFLLLALASAFTSNAPAQATRGAAYYLITGFVVMMAIVNGTFNRRFVYRAINAVALISVAISALGIIELVLADFLAPTGAHRLGLGVSSLGISSTLGSPIALATYLLLGMPCVLASVARSQTRESRDFWVAAAVICLIGVLLTRSPVGLAALSLIAPLYAWWHFSPLWGAICFTALTPVAGLAVARHPGITDLGWAELLCGSGAAFCRSIGDLPLKEILLGIGPRTLGEISPSLPLGIPESALRATNTNVHLLIENGVLGWLAMLWILFAGIGSLYRTQKAIPDPGLRTILWAVIYAMVGFFLAMWAFDPFDNIALQLLFWGLVGIGVGTEVRLGGRSADYRIALKLGH